MAHWLGKSSPTRTEPLQSNADGESLSSLRQRSAKESSRRSRKDAGKRRPWRVPGLPSVGPGWGNEYGRIKMDTPFFRSGSDLALGGIIFLAPLIFGGRHPLGRLVYILLVTLLLACWVGERFCKGAARWKFSGVEWLLIAGTLLLFVQTLHLPTHLLTRISPNMSDLTPHWGSELMSRMGYDNWNHISLTPHATQLAIGVFVAHAALFLVLVQRFQRTEEIPRILKWIAVSATGMAVLALLQFASGTQKYVWIFEHPSRPANAEVMGAFSNTNHFSHFLALGLGPLVWWLSRLKPKKSIATGPTGNRFGSQDSVLDWWNIGLIAAIAIVGFAIFLSHSRGGILVMFLAVSVSVVLLIRQKQLGQHSWFALAVIGVLLFGLLTIRGFREVTSELATLTSGSLEQIDDDGARQKIWGANWEVIRRFPILGTGVGSHAEVYPRFFPYRSSVDFTHAESGYIQVLTETGWIGGGLLLLGLFACARWTVGALGCRETEMVGCAAAIASGLAVSAFHSVFDFPWYLTSCLSLAIIMAAAACSLYQHNVEGDLRKTKRQLPFTKPRDARDSKPATRIPVGGLIGLAFLVALAWCHVGPARGARHWDRYLKISLNSQRSLHHQLLRSRDRLDRSEKLAANRHENTRLMAAHLEQCLIYHPTHPQAHVKMAGACLKLFEDAQKESQNAMELTQIRDAAIASKFADQDKLNAWLDVAIGEPRALLDKAFYHCVQAQRITPVEGRSYVQAAQLAFLRQVDDAGVQELLSAAIHVRPHDAYVLYQNGRETALRGDLESTIDYWRQSFEMNKAFRSAIIARLAPHFTARLFIDKFQMDAEGMEQLFSFYSRQEMMEHASTVGPIVVKNILEQARDESGVPAGKRWHRCRSIYRFLGQPKEALQCAQHATRAAPNWFEGRLTLAEEFMAQEYYAQAIEQYQWCQQRKPFDARIRQRINIAETLVAKQNFQSVESLANDVDADGTTAAPLTLGPPAPPSLAPRLSQQPTANKPTQRF